MIDLLNEQVLTIPEAAKRLPGRRGKPIHVSTVYRWIQTGVEGIRLEAARMGGTMVTSVEALQRFLVGLSSGSPTRLNQRPGPRKRRRGSPQSRQTLRELGLE